MFKMAVTIVSFRWLEILEKEFDKNFVDLDLLIGDLDAEEPDFVYSARQKLAGLSSCFAQLTHKAQTIFQNSAKVEAELVDLRTELVNSKTRQEVLEEESRSLVLQLHSLQLDRLPSNQNPEQYKEKIETALRLSPSKSAYSDEITFRNNSEIKKLKNELLQYQSENIILRNSILALHSEVYGARLAAKYLDKELAGRIQQLQLLGKEMRTDVRDKLWRQLESEILLHRHKTVIRACRNRTNHEFIQSDSRILNLHNHSEERYLKNEFARSDPFRNLKNRQREYELKKSEAANNNKKQPCADEGVSSRNAKESFLNSREEPGFDVNNEKSDRGHEKEKTTVEKIINVESNDCSLKESPRNSCNREKDKDAAAASEKEGCKNEEKTDEEKPEREESSREVTKTDKKRNCSTDGEEFNSMSGDKRTVIVKRQPGQGLGISITGGREHGVPILISELEIGGPAYESKNLYVGDAILKVNDISLEDTSHFEAVKILTNLETNNVKLLVQFIAVDTDEENSLSDDLYGYRYRFFDSEVMDSSDALGLHPLHSNSAHTPTAPRTPDYARMDKHLTVNCYQNQKQTFDEYNSSVHSGEAIESQDHSRKEEFVSSQTENYENLIDIETEITEKENSERLKIDLFGFRFQTDMREMEYPNENLLDDFLVKKPEGVKPEADLIQIEVGEPKPGASAGGVAATAAPPPPPPPPMPPAPSASEKKFEYVDENIFSGLEDHSILDNIMKSFSEDDFSCFDTEKEKNVTSDSGLEVCLSGSDVDVDRMCVEELCRDNKNYVHEWNEKTAEKVELKTLQQIFDRSFSSNLSSPRGSTSFDDDILSTEHSDEKSNSNDFKNKTRDLENGYNPKKIQKFYPKKCEVTEEVPKKSFTKNDSSINLKNEVLNVKKVKRNSSDTIKRCKSGRKSKENVRKEVKVEKRKNSKELEPDLSTKVTEVHKKRDLNYKITDRFEENLIEYNVKSYEVNELSPVKVDNRLQGFEKTGEKLEDIGDELEETRKLSRKYGLKIPGKGVKTDLNNMVVVTEVKTPERCIKVLESHFKHFKPILDGSVKVAEKETKAKAFRCSRYDSFGDPDFGTPV